MEKFTSTLEAFDSDVYSHGLIVPQAVSRKFIKGTNRRVICELNGIHTFQCALMPGGNGACFIIVNKEIRRKLGLEPGDPVMVNLQKDDSEYGMDFPVELSEALKLEPEANEYFHALSMGKQRNLIYLVNQVKRPETRIKKSLVIASFLKDSGGKLDFKALLQAFKNANQ